MFKWIKSYMPKRLYFRAALILVFPVVFLQLIVSIVFIQRHFEGVTVQMTRTVAAELDLITEIIEREGAVAAQQIARSLGMSMSIVAQDTKFLERRRVYDLTGLVAGIIDIFFAHLLLCLFLKSHSCIHSNHGNS